MTHDGPLPGARLVESADESRSRLRPEPLETLRPNLRRVAREQDLTSVLRHTNRLRNEPGAIDSERRDAVLYADRDIEQSISECQLDRIHEKEVAVSASAKIRGGQTEIFASNVDSHGPSDIRSDLLENASVATTKLQNPIRATRSIDHVLDLGLEVLADPRGREFVDMLKIGTEEVSLVVCTHPYLVEPQRSLQTNEQRERSADGLADEPLRLRAEPAERHRHVRTHFRVPTQESGTRADLVSEYAARGKDSGSSSRKERIPRASVRSPMTSTLAEEVRSYRRDQSTGVWFLVIVGMALLITGLFVGVYADVFLGVWFAIVGSLFVIVGALWVWTLALRSDASIATMLEAQKRRDAEEVRQIMASLGREDNPQPETQSEDPRTGVSPP